MFRMPGDTFGQRQTQGPFRSEASKEPLWHAPLECHPGGAEAGFVDRLRDSQAAMIDTRKCSVDSGPG